MILSMQILYFFLLLLSFLMIFSARWATGYFGLSCFEQIIFHLKAPLEGTNTEFIFDWLKLCLLKALFLTILLFFILSYTPFTSFIVPLILVLATIYSGQVIGLWSFIINLFRHSDLYERFYVDPKSVLIKSPEKKKNLIIVYVESLENTYSSKENGGNYHDDLIKGLSKLAFENTHFSNTEKLGGAKVIAGTGWTTGGIIAETSGIPLLVPLNTKRFKDGVPFLKGAVTLGDILKKEGYFEEFIIGSNAYFGGRKFYFDSHANDLIFDYPYAVNNAYIEKDYHVFWGFEDDKLLAFAKEEILKAAKKEEPFFISLLTVDTHHPKGYKGKDYQKIYPERLSNIIALNAAKVADFVAWLKRQDFYDDTAVLITGDHTSMAQEYISHTYDKNYERTIFNTYINAALKPQNPLNRQFTPFDYFPTTLAALGFKIEGERLGFGTNLFSDQKTLVEKTSFNYLDKELRKQSAYFKKKLL